MTDKIFIDSNVWIYLFTSDDESKNTAAKNFIAKNSADNTFVISYQVINEVSSVMKKKKFKESHIQFVVETMSDICIVQDFSIDIILSASDLREKDAFSFWDSLIVSSANAAKCSFLVSEDMQNNRVINGTRIKNIF